jgi:hypothetical protein
VRVALCALALQLGCAAPTQRDAVIHIDQAAFAARLQMMCRLGVTDEVARKACEAKTVADKERVPSSDRATASPNE